MEFERWLHKSINRWHDGYWQDIIISLDNKVWHTDKTHWFIFQFKTNGSDKASDNVCTEWNGYEDDRNHPDMFHVFEISLWEILK